MVSSPAPVGGTSLRSDVAPSASFAMLYGFLFPPMMLQVFTRRSQTTLLFGTACFCIERIVLLSLRAVQGHDESKRYSTRLATYMQISLGLGFIFITVDLIGVIRCILVNATYGPERYPESSAALSTGGPITPPPEGTPDLPKARFWARRLTDLLAVTSVVAAMLGIIANAHYGDVFDDQKRADMTATIRMVSSAVALAVTVICTCVVLWSNLGLRRVHKRPVLILTSVCILLSIVAINRLSVMHGRMNSLSGFNPLNSSASKVTFYTLHIFPEWVATLVLLLAEVRKTFGTGPFGDLRWQDETPMEKKKRLAKQAAIEEKKGISMANMKKDNVDSVEMHGNLDQNKLVAD